MPAGYAGPGTAGGSPSYGAGDQSSYGAPAGFGGPGTGAPPYSAAAGYGGARTGAPPPYGAPAGYSGPGYGVAPPGYGAPPAPAHSGASAAAGWSQAGAPGWAPAGPPGYPQSGGYGGPPAGTPYPPAWPAPAPTPPSGGQWEAATVRRVEGTDFGLVELKVSPLSSGQATGSLIAGIGSILVALLVLFFGLIGSTGNEHWGGWVAGAFCLLGVLVGGGALALGLLARRQIRGSATSGSVRFSGRGLAIAGISCGGAGAGISLLSLALSLVLLWS